MEKNKLRIVVIALQVLGITFLNYYTGPEFRRLHIFYRGFFFVPVMLASFWFGVRGGIATSLAICALYIPYALERWKTFTDMDLDRIIDVILYNVVALIMGTLSDRQKVDQKLAREAANLAAVGKSVSAVAHDMKAPLMAIGGFTLLVKKHIPPDHPHRDKLDIVIDETRRLEGMVRDMLDFSRPLALELSAESLDAVVGECIEIVEIEARKRNIALRHRAPPGLVPAMMDRMRMKQVFINLLMNAVQASPDGERVTVISYQTKHRSVVEVIDCGCGIPLEKREEVFMPFFSTKKDGTGLGLAIVRKIVDAHRGRIEVLDNRRRGTVFRVMFPTSENGGG